MERNCTNPVGCVSILWMTNQVFCYMSYWFVSSVCARTCAYESCLLVCICIMFPCVRVPVLCPCVCACLSCVSGLLGDLKHTHGVIINKQTWSYKRHINTGMIHIQRPETYTYTETNTFTHGDIKHIHTWRHETDTQTWLTRIVMKHRHTGAWNTDTRRHGTQTHTWSTDTHTRSHDTHTYTDMVLRHINRHDTQTRYTDTYTVTWYTDKRRNVSCIIVFHPSPHFPVGVETQEHDCSNLVEEILGPARDSNKDTPQGDMDQANPVICMHVLPFWWVG